MTHPYRVQRSRSKGSSLPPDVIYAGRPGPLGNPVETAEKFRSLIVDHKLETNVDRRPKWIEINRVFARDAAIRKIIETGYMTYKSQLVDIRGKRLACWCGLDQECHVDVILWLLQMRWPEFYSEKGRA